MECFSLELSQNGGAKVIAEVIHKNIQPDMPLHNDTELKNKNIGYSDYTD